MRVLITGAGGFVGRVLTSSLAGAGFEIRAAARRPEMIPAAPSVERVTLPDLAHPVDWRPLLEGMDAVVHLAGIAHVTDDIPEDRYDRVNRVATKELALACALASHIKRLVFVSSIRAQTGPVAENVLTEDSPPLPSDAYGRSKLAAEAFVRGYGAPHTILRPVVIYGADARANMAQLARIASLPLPLPFGSFANRRSLLALDNMISAIRFVLATPATQNQTYIVADPTALSLAQMIETLRRARGRSSMLLPIPPRCIETALRLAGRQTLWERIGASLVADSGKLRAAGWRPVTDTPKGLMEMVTPPRP